MAAIVVPGREVTASRNVKKKGGNAQLAETILPDPAAQLVMSSVRRDDLDPA